MALRPPLDVETFTDLRKLSRWCEDQAINADADSVTTVQLQNEAVTYAKIQDVTADRILGRLTSAGVVSELTAAEVATLLQAAIEVLDLAFSGDIGFHGEAASAQQSTPSTLSMTTISGSGDDANINSNFAAIQSAVNALKTALDTKGLTG